MRLGIMALWRSIYLRYPAEIFIIASTTLFVVVYISINQNILFLSLLFSFHLALAMLVGKLRYFTLLLFVAISCIPLNVPLVTFSKLSAANHRYETGGDNCTLLKANEQWRFQFTVNDLEKYQKLYGQLQGRIVIDGVGLSGLKTVVNGNSIHSQIRITKKYHLEQLSIPITVNKPSVVELSLGTDNPEGVLVYNIGTEFSNSMLYNTGVWLEFRNADAVVAYHSIPNVSLRNSSTIKQNENQ